VIVKEMKATEFVIIYLGVIDIAVNEERTFRTFQVFAI